MAPNPSSSSASTALTVSGKPQLSLNKQEVLEEDEYTEALSAIIKRDFFPSLVHLDATNNYLSALDTQDPELIQASVRHLTDLATAPTPTPRYRDDGRTPYTNFPSDTPLRTPRTTTSGPPPAKKPRYDSSLSLDEFQARYTSEDNASFTEILNEENKDRKDRHAWAWKAQDRVSLQKAKEVEGRERRLLETGTSLSEKALGKRKAITGGPEVLEITENGETVEVGADEESEDSEAEVEDALEDGDKPHHTAESKNLQLIYTEPGDVGPVDAMAPLKDHRSAAVHGWKFKARNAFMFGPGADESPYDPQPPSAESALTLKAGTIVYANTRLPEQSEEVPEAPPSPTRSRIAAAISGTPYAARSDSPKVRGFGYVDAVPSPSPSQLGPLAINALMTQGTLLGTPRVISGSDDPVDAVSSPFVIKNPSSRDLLGRRLGNEAGRAMTKKASVFGGQTPRTPASSSTAERSRTSSAVMSTPRRVDMLTPAARRLLDRTRAGAGISASAAPATGRTGLLGGAITPLSRDKRRNEKRLDLRNVGWGDSPRVTR